MSVKIKICGLTRLEDARAALDLGADELGFVLAPSSRRVEPETVKAILDALKGELRRDFRAAGVFVNERAETMRDIIAYTGLTMAQVHGDETSETCSAFDFPWYRALRIDTVADAHALVGGAWRCGRLLVDAAVRGSYGGTGSSIGTWAALASRALAREAGKEFFVAGGIKPRNAASFVYSLSPDGLDVSSGVEESPGIKSRAKLEELFREVRRAESAYAASIPSGAEEAMNAAR